MSQKILFFKFYKETCVYLIENIDSISWKKFAELIVLWILEEELIVNIKINEKLQEYNTPILLFTFGSVLGLWLGVAIHEALHSLDRWKARSGRKREAFNYDDEPNLTVY